MKIVLASTSQVKIDACKDVFAMVKAVDIQPVKVASGVSEQPFNEETVKGAFNRLAAASQAIPDADLYVSIENGIFEEDGKYMDRTVAAICFKGGEPQISYSDGVEFPAAAVEEARKRGFDTWTVGKVMAEQGIVTRHDDPHLDLSGISRTNYIKDALISVVCGFENKP